MLLWLLAWQMLLHHLAISLEGVKGLAITALFWVGWRWRLTSATMMVFFTETALLLH